ncbi:DUF7278 family profilin-like fold-containing protein [Enterococcus sp. CWB-B31]|uniref:DUF7278 family profilin-like fold-containing protein n=1 Tax=Enterococcus sp. CWB-B31 TaxID=2885159 RepID=UPI001E405DCF|nr:hypothetical protein [Enterococcus sp. CWB-B31]MCB5956315.1 hypothetical protein [Enterococcus sp. CWB-B31]
MEQLDWVNWKQLSDSVKKTVFQQLLLYYVDPNIEITDIRLKNFELYGIKCRTFELELDGETFVFIPGNREAILGWDLGVEGLRSHELVNVDSAEIENQTYKAMLSRQEIDEAADWLNVEDSYDFSTLEGISLYINDHTSELRKRKIAPMLVQKYALPAGTSILGILDTVTGTFRGEVGIFLQFEEEIKTMLFPPLSAQESIFWEFPKTLHKKNCYYLEFVPTTDSYLVYSSQDCTHAGLKKRIAQKGFEMLSEDHWEFAAGAGTRRLFRWGNELKIYPNSSGQHILEKINGPNMFGLIVDSHMNRYELTRESSSVKLERQRPKQSLIENMLPLSTYYQSEHIISAEQILSPDMYLYRKAILVDYQ